MISVIIPTFNRFEIVKETIQKSIAISSDIVFEIIVVNDGQELPFSISHPNLTFLKNTKKGVASARNFGAANARYPVLFFTDDDMWMTAETLQLISGLQQNKMLEDNYFNLNWEYPQQLQEELKTNKIGRYLLNSNYHTLEGRANIKIDCTKPITDTVGIGSGSFCISRENFIKTGGYNESIEFQGEDIDMAVRLKANNIQAKLATALTCYHNQKDRLEIDSFLERDYRGFLSQAKAGMVNMTESKQRFYNVLYPFHHLIKWIFNIIPNVSLFDKITFRLIGILSSLSYVKAIQEAKKHG